MAHLAAAGPLCQVPGVSEKGMTINWHVQPLSVSQVLLFIASEFMAARFAGLTPEMVERSYVAAGRSWQALAEASEQDLVNWGDTDLSFILLTSVGIPIELHSALTHYLSVRARKIEENRVQSQFVFLLHFAYLPFISDAQYPISVK